MPIEKGQRALPGPGALVPDTACIATIRQVVMNRAAMPHQVSAWRACGLVMGKGLALIKGQRDTAIGGAGRAIRGLLWQFGAQPTASSKEARNSVESSASGATESPMRTMSPPNLPTVAMCTPALPAFVIIVSAASKLHATR